MVTKNVEVISALDFLSTLFSILKTKNVNVVSSEKLLTTIGKYRNNFLGLFIDMDINNNCGTVYSNDLEEGISMLQILGAISKSNPKYERIILKMNKDSANEIIAKCPQKYLIEIQDFSDIFLNEE